VGFAVAAFLAGRLWSLECVREAQRAAGLAEEDRLEIQLELNECSNALLLERERAEAPGKDDPDPARNRRVSLNPFLTGSSRHPGLP
jgi:hypothetical protein